jgi:hypothetical protein
VKTDIPKETITRAAAPLFRDQIEKRIHPFDGTGAIIERWRWFLRLHATTLFG